MAVSGSYNYNINATELITEALRIIGELRAGQTASSDQITDGVTSLNILIKSWQNRGINLFAVQKAYVFMQNDQVKYELSSTGDHWSTSIVNNSIATAAASGAATIAVEDDEDMSDADNIGIELDSGTIQWTTINGAPASNIVTLTAVLTGAAAAGNRVYTYTTKANRPMKILEAVRTDAESNEDIPIFVRSLRDYADQPNKDTEAPVNMIYFDPQRNTSYMYVWPEPDRVDVFLSIWVQRTLDDIDTNTDDLAFPQEWYQALASGLAAKLAPKYWKNVQESMHKWSMLIKLADKELDDAENWDTEDGFSIEPANERNREL